MSDLTVLVNQVVMDLSLVVLKLAYAANRPDLADEVQNILDTYTDTLDLQIAEQKGLL